MQHHELLETTANVYRQAAQEPQVGLCCTTSPVWQLPGLRIPQRMLSMNYGCGSTVNPRDLPNSPAVLYAGVGLTGSLPLQEYLDLITEVGFGTVEVRARRAYRVLSPQHYATSELLYIESVEVCAIKDPMPADGPCIFTGRTAIYCGQDEYFDDQKGHVLLQNQPLAVCDKTAGALAALGRADVFISPATYHYGGGGCC